MNKSKTDISIRDNTGLRRQVNIIIGDSAGFSSGDILDANAVVNIVGEGVKEDVLDIKDDIDSLADSVDNIQTLISADENQIDTAIDKFEEIVQFLEGIEPGSELYDIIHSHIDNGTTQVIKHVEVMTLAEYNALTTKQPNTEYNIIES